MIEIGAGGGSIAEPDARGTIRVGPKSAGASPGPACYGQGGTEVTLSDANLVLGYLDPDYFLGGEMRLERSLAERAITDRVARPLDPALERAAFGIHDIASEDVARAFRIHASERGFDYRSSSMVAFGGSGPVHAIRVAKKLGIPRVVFPVAAGVMSAIGLRASPLAFEVALNRERFVIDLDDIEFAATFAEVEAEAAAPLVAAGLDPSRISVVRRLDMHYHGQAHEIEMTLPADDCGVDRLADLFRRRYEAFYAFAPLDAPLVINSWKVEAQAPDPGIAASYSIGRPSGGTAAAQKGVRRAWFPDAGGWVAHPRLRPLRAHDRQRRGGPCAHRGTRVHGCDRPRRPGSCRPERQPRCGTGHPETGARRHSRRRRFAWRRRARRAHRRRSATRWHSGGHVVSGPTSAAASLDAVSVGILWDRLVTIADEIVSVLVRTSFSTIVSESYDLTVAVLDGDGELMAQGTFSLPVFMGTAPATLRHMLERFPAETLQPGDVIITNDPWYGTGHIIRCQRDAPGVPARANCRLRDQHHPSSGYRRARIRRGCGGDLPRGVAPADLQALRGRSPQ